MSNVLAVQSLGGNKREGQRFKNASEESFKRFRTESLLKFTYQQAGSLAFMLGQVLFFIVIAGRVIDGTFTAGDYFVVQYYFFVLSATFAGSGYIYTNLQANIAGLRRVFFLMDLTPEKTREGALLPRIADGIEMKGVGLTYPDGRRALRNIDLRARIGEIVAFVGPTGAGKTSLAYMAPAFIQATEGTVSIDGVDLKEVSVDELREQVSYVFQETQLFSDSILENIRYGKKDAAQAEVERVARVAGAHDFIAALPEGYRTNLGTVTSKLSVGQKQRIAIARGLLRDARILILDEPTSALDPETEAYLVDALHEAARDRLVIIIAHRLSTIAHADRIYFLEEGEIREQGSHEELMAVPDGHYRSLCHAAGRGRFRQAGGDAGGPSVRSRPTGVGNNMALPPDYAERVYAGVLGKVIGVYLGRPFEGWPYEWIQKRLGDIEYYVHDRLDVPLIVTDDDISGTFTFLRALEDHGSGADLSSKEVGETWLNYLVKERTVLWWGGLGNSTEHTAYLRLRNGVEAPESGSMERNGKVVAEQIGAQIFIDGWAMVAPGDPDQAVRFADAAARVGHDGEGVYGARVVAAMESMAFVESDTSKLLDAALRYIPPDSVIATMIGDLRDWHARDSDWRRARGPARRALRLRQVRGATVTSSPTTA